MGLKYQVENLENIEESYRSLYREDTGKYFLDVEGVKPIQDFDNVQNALRKERELRSDFEKKYKSFGERTPDTFIEMEQKVKELELQLEAGKGNSEDIEGKIKNIKDHYESKIDATKTDYMKKVAELESMVQEREAQILDTNMEKCILEEIKNTVKSEALSDALKLAKFEVTYNKDMDRFESVDGLELKEWAEKFLKERPHIVRESSSGGATGNTGGNSIKNPFKSGDFFNMTEQARLFRENPKLAEKLRKEAGK